MFLEKRKKRGRKQKQKTKNKLYMYHIKRRQIEEGLLHKISVILRWGMEEKKKMF